MINSANEYEPDVLNTFCAKFQNFTVRNVHLRTRISTQN